MSEKFHRTEPATSWSKHAALEAEGKRLEEAARKRKKDAATLAKRTKIVRDEPGAVSKKLEDVPIHFASTSIPSARQSAAREETVSGGIAANPLSEHQDQDGGGQDEVGDYDWDSTGFYDDRALTSKQSSRRAVYEKTQGRVGKRQAMETIGGRYRTGSKDLVRGNVNIVQIGPENAGWKKGDQTHFERVEQERARRSADLKRNVRRGSSIRDLEEIPPSERSETFVRDMDALSRQYTVSADSQEQNSPVMETPRTSSALEKTSDRFSNNAEQRGNGRKKSGRGPRTDRPFTSERDRSSSSSSSLSVDRDTAHRFQERAQNTAAKKADKRFWLNRIYSDMLRWFGRG